MCKFIFMPAGRLMIWVMKKLPGVYTEGGKGVIEVEGGYQPFLENKAGMVRINIYRFSNSDLFCM
jgi:hypothetical protein